MATLLLRLSAPMQSWGYDSKFEIRNTGSEPSKSGVVGMLAASLGLRRDADLSKLNALRFGVRADKEGVLLRDFQTVKAKKPYVTNRYYLCDAVFLVGLESDDEEYLNELQNSLKHPKFPLFLGRRSCPPTLPLVKGLRNCSLEDALKNEPSLSDKINNPVRIQIEQSDSENADIKRDVAVSFNPKKRLYSYRKVKETYIDIDHETEHDPMKELQVI